jgi:glycosyltransferase involved in cell wall biosynthesis
MNRIIIIGTAYPYRGGLASFNEMLARTFTLKGKEVQVITFKLQYPELLFPGKTQFSDSPSPDDLNIKRMVNSVNPFNWIRTGRYIRKQCPDMLILKYWTPFMAPCLSVICRIAGKNKHTVVISQLDNVIPHEKHFYDSWLTRYFVRSVDGFIYMSRQVKDDLDMFTTEKPSVFAPHPVFSNFGEKVSKEEACNCLNMATDIDYVLFFGLIRDYKGLDLIIDAWSELKRNGTTRKKKLLIAGEFYADKTKYIRQIEKLGLHNDILLHDRFIKDEEVKYYFSLADMVVQPYKSATQSGVTQIAYQFDVPMVVTDVGGLSEIVPDRKVGLVVPPDASAIAQAIEEIYAQHYLQNFKMNIKTEKLRFSWDYFTEKITELYQTATKKIYS